MADLATPSSHSLGEVAPVQDADLNALATFLAAWPGETFTAAAWQERFDHWWKHNPYFAPASTRGFLIKDNDRIAGFFGILPIGFQLDGKETVVYATTTWRVEPQMRHLSLAAISQVLHYTRDSLLFAWTGNLELGRIFTALKFVALPRPAVYQREEEVLMLGLTNVRQRPLRLLGPLASVYARVAQSRASRSGSRYTVRQLKHADAAFDQLWTRTRSLVAHTNPRTSTFLNWHCFAGKQFPKRLYGCYSGDTLSGLLVASEYHPRGLRMLECADVWVEPGPTGAVDALLAQLCADARQDRFDGIVLPPYSDELLRIARRIGFLPRRRTPFPEFVHGPAEATSALQKGSTYLCGLQGDRLL